MGIVIRQSFWGSFFSYLGVIIGFVNAGILMPKFMTPTEIGLQKGILSMAFFLVPFIDLGVTSTIVRFFPSIPKNQIKDLFGLGVLVNLITFIVFFFVLYAFQDWLMRPFVKNSGEIIDYTWLVSILLIQVVSYNFMQSISRLYYDVALPSFLGDTIHKVLHTSTISLFAVGYIDFHQYLIGQLYIYVVIQLILFVKLVFADKFSVSFININKLQNKRKMAEYALFVLLGGFGGAMVVQVDQLMILSLLGTSYNGIYATALVIISIIEIPRKYIVQIVLPLINEAFVRNDKNYVQTNYQKVSINQMIIGSILFLGIVTNLHSIFEIMPNGEKFIGGYWIVVLVGIAKLTDMAFSIGGEIISLSKYFRYNVLMILVLALLTFVLNIALIPPLGINGAALATVLTLLFHAIFKCVFVYRTLGYFPFTHHTVSATGVLLILTISGLTLEPCSNPYFNILIKGSVIVSIYITYIWFFKPSEDLRQVLVLGLSKLKGLSK